MLYGDKIVGGGPATTSRAGQPLDSIAQRLHYPEIMFISENGTAQSWNWQASGTMEMNCFLCHLETPNILKARADVHQSGGNFS
jgi:hypothetical protein